MENSNELYVVLEHLLLPNRGFRFWSMNTPNSDHRKLNDGKEAYKVVCYTSSEKKAIEDCRNFNLDAVPTQRELLDHYADSENRK